MIISYDSQLQLVQAQIISMDLDSVQLEPSFSMQGLYIPGMLALWKYVEVGTVESAVRTEYSFCVT